MALSRLATPSVIVNNESAYIAANTVMYDEGLGEDVVTPESAGGNRVRMTTAKNVETLKSKVQFELHNTSESIEKARSWKVNSGENTVTLQDPNDPSFSKTFTNMTLINQYEVNLTSDGTISVEFEGDAAV